MKNLYLISGLGADYRAFQNLDLSKYNVNHMLWIKPEKTDGIHEYASRLLSQIKDKKPILIGLSFGGIIAIEIGKLIETEKIILISSAQSTNDIPLYLRLIGKLGLHKLLPGSFIKNVNIITHWFFGIESNREKELLKLILEDTNTDFLKWAINAIVRWRTEVQFNNVFRVHGTNDRLLPLRKAHFIIQGGGHFMILNKHKEISKILNTLLDD